MRRCYQTFGKQLLPAEMFLKLASTTHRRIWPVRGAGGTDGVSGCETNSFYQVSPTPGSEQHTRWALGWGVQVSLEASPSAPAAMLLSPRQRS